MKTLIPKSSTLIFLILIIFLFSIFLGHKFLLKNLQNNHETTQKILFYEIQKYSNSLLSKLLYDYSLKKEVILSKHKEVLKYLETHSYDGDLSKIYEEINEGLADKPYNIYITDENLIIKNTTFKQDLGFDLNFAKNLFDKHNEEKIIGVSAPVFETSSINFFSFSDSYLPKNKKRLLQISYKYSDVDFNLKLIQNSIDSNENIENSISYIVFNDGYIGDFIFKSFKSYKPSLEEINNRLKKGKELSSKISNYEYITEEFTENDKYIKIIYFGEKTLIYKDAKIIYSVIFDETLYLRKIKFLNTTLFSLFFMGLIAIYFIYILRNKEQLLSYKDKFIEHSMHEIKTPLSIIKLNDIGAVHPGQWKDYVLSKIENWSGNLPKINVYIGGSELDIIDNGFDKDDNILAISLDRLNSGIMSATDIRKSIINKNDVWRDHVPYVIQDYMLNNFPEELTIEYQVKQTLR